MITKLIIHYLETVPIEWLNYNELDGTTCSDTTFLQL